jgi:ribosomal protein L15
MEGSERASGSRSDAARRAARMWRAIGVGDREEEESTAGRGEEGVQGRTEWKRREAVEECEAVERVRLCQRLPGFFFKRETNKAQL